MYHFNIYKIMDDDNVIDDNDDVDGNNNDEDIECY
jgi:hypothetical protein